MPDYLRTGGKCPYLAINVLSFPSSKCFCCRRCVLQQCLPAFVQEKIILEKFSHQVFDVSGSTYPRPRVMTCRCRELHMDTTLWLTMIWRSIAFDDDEEDDIWNHPTIHTSCIAGTVSGDWEGEVWILGEVEAPAGSTSDLQVGDWRPQVRREGDLKKSWSRMMWWLLRWPTWISCTVNSRLRARTNIQPFRRWQSDIGGRHQTDV